MSNKKPRVLNFYAGPGTGKSTMAAAVFAELKFRGCNIEIVPEFAKDATWERRGEKVFKAQEYLFGKQHFRLVRLNGEVDFVITDSPILLCDVYTPDDFNMPSMRKVFVEAYNNYDNLDIFLVRNKPYNPAGRNQTSEQAVVLDQKILAVLEREAPEFIKMDYGRHCVDDVIQILEERGWVKPMSATSLEAFVDHLRKLILRYTDKYLKLAWNVTKERASVLATEYRAAAGATKKKNSIIYPFMGVRKRKDDTTYTRKSIEGYAEYSDELLEKLKNFDYGCQECKVGVVNKWGTYKYVYFDKETLQDPETKSFFNAAKMGTAAEGDKFQTGQALNGLLFYLAKNHPPSKVFFEPIAKT